MPEVERLSADFFRRSALEVAPELIGMRLCHRSPEGEVLRLVISETEAYMGAGDSACHASKGRTKRNEPLYMDGGTVYVYLCYGIHWLMNVITSVEDDPQGVLIRACIGAEGPGRLTKFLGIDKRVNRCDIGSSPDIWIERGDLPVDIETDTRVGIGYAAPEDQARLWRFKMRRK